MSRSLFILHFQPIENYPPIQNFIEFAQKNKEEQIICCSTSGKLELKKFSSSIRMHRFGMIQGSKLRLWFSYLYFNLFSLIKLCLKRPDSLLYYETLSAFPAYVYLKWLKRKARLYIHYHEYTSKKEYQSASFIERYFHQKEKALYQLASWISHTNEVRLKKFIHDENLKFDPKIFKVLPNYPSRSWSILNKKRVKDQPLKIVFVGYTLTEGGSYLKELIAYLKTLKIQVYLDVYCVKENKFLEEYTGLQNNVKVSVKKAVPYESLPEKLSQHHVGVILYRANTPNYIYNAPNKLFEYLSCGLDVWYPSEMEGIYEYDRDISPKVKRLDFTQLENHNLVDLVTLEKDTIGQTAFYAEDIYVKLMDRINQG